MTKQKEVNLKSNQLKESGRRNGSAVPAYEFELFAGASWYFDLPEASELQVGQNFLLSLPEQAPPQTQKEDLEWSQYLKDLAACRLCEKENLLADPGHIRSEYGAQISPRVLFVGDFYSGEGDGEQGECFSGPIRDLLLKMIRAMNLKDQEFALTLSAKCRPQSSEVMDPLLSSCKKHLTREILLLRPKVIVTLGAMATRNLLGENLRLSKVHGQFLEYRIEHKGKEMVFPVVPIFHPSYLMINPNMKKTAWVDLQKIMQYLEKPQEKE